MNRLAPRVLVIDRRAVIGTEICRAESAHGCKVDVFAEPESPVFRSRFCDRRFVMHGLDEPAFAAELSSVASAHQYDAIYVCNEEVLARIVALSAGANWRGLLIPPPDLLKIALSKNATLSLVASAGVPVPMTVIPNDEDDLRTFGRRFSLPIIVKGDTGESGQNIEVVSKIDDLVGAYRAVLARETRPGSKPAVQEFIPGFSYSLGALVHRGRPLRVVSYRKLIKYPPPWGGLTVKGITERDPQLLAEGFKVFEAFQYSGIGHVEFIRDSRDGHFKFLEINPRIWGSIAVARWAGVDLFTPYRQLVNGSCVDSDLRYEEGVLFHSILREIQLIRRRPKRLFSFLMDSFDSRVHSEFTWTDPRPHLPTLYRLRKLLKGNEAHGVHDRVQGGASLDQTKRMK